MCSIFTKGSACHKNKKIEIFVDLNRAGHNKSVEKKISVLAQIFTKLWAIYELHNYIILIIILNIIIKLTYIIIKKQLFIVEIFEKKYIE